LDVILDVRPKSKTFGKYFTIKLNLLSPLVISIPYGCAHGFLSLEENSIITYFQSGTYEKEYDTGIRYDSFGFEWPVKEPIISQRDKLFQNFDDFKLL
jgi:dTDP-4-dehydrorhamnose 3,5-epimerase/CDP-3, 6-dideoxy-D-glycero-D-glycero-4-hexulose-5-epimerase